MVRICYDLTEKGNFIHVFYNASQNVRQMNTYFSLFFLHWHETPFPIHIKNIHIYSEQGLDIRTNYTFRMDIWTRVF